MNCAIKLWILSISQAFLLVLSKSFANAIKFARDWRWYADSTLRRIFDSFSLGSAKLFGVACFRSFIIHYISISTAALWNLDRWYGKVENVGKGMEDKVVWAFLIRLLFT